MLWIQQKERDQVVSVAPIPTALNSADIGAKNLPKKRLRGLLQYMIHMVDAVGDCVGEQEFRETEKEYQLKQGVKKFGKSEDLRIGLLMINKVGSTSTEVKEDDETDWTWMMLCTCACIGALSLFSWLRNYMNEFLDCVRVFIRDNVKAMVQIKKIYMNVQVEMVDQETQASQRVDHMYMARYEEELREAENTSTVHRGT